MIWKGMSTRRVPGPPAVVIREPEAGWWRAQAEFDRRHRGPATTTVAVLHDDDAGTDAMVTRLAELAVNDDLLVVCGSVACARAGDAATVTGLRGRLPSHDVLALQVGAPGTETRLQAVTLERALHAGSVPVVVTALGVLHDVTAEISSLVRADRVLRVFGTATGASLHQVWRRSEPCVN